MRSSHLCIMIRAKDEAMAGANTSATGKYMVATKYGGVLNQTQHYPPRSFRQPRHLRRWATIMRDGTTVQIPYHHAVRLTTISAL